MANRRRPLGIRISLLLLSLALVAASPVSAQIAIGYCQGTPGVFETFSVTFLVCCPGDLTATEVTVTTGPVDCGSAAAVMAAVNAAIGTMMSGGSPIFAAPVAVPSPVPGQARFEYPLSMEFLDSECCIIGGSVDFECGTMSLRINPPPCAKTGDPGDWPVQLCIDGPPPGPSTLNLILEGCPLVDVPLDGDETAAEVRAELLAALLLAGYSAFLNDDGKVEIVGDCMGELPMGVDEFGLSGGLPMAQGILVVCPPDDPVPFEDTTWGAVKASWGRSR